MTRREFLGAAGAIPLVYGSRLLGAPAPQKAVRSAGVPQWWRGQMHMHSYWSDGNAFPEQAADMYRQAGYNFLAFTEHNAFAADQDKWRSVAVSGGIPQDRFDDYAAAFGSEVESKVEGGVTKVRLKTCAEVKARFDASGSFLVMPGMEITQSVSAPESHPAGVQLHMNTLNIPAALASSVPGGYTTTQMIGRNAALAAAAGVAPQQYTLALNHPFWVFCDIVPQNLIDRSEIRFFEVCNGGSSYTLPAGAENYSCEKFWDSVNAFRRLQRQPLLYGLGTDDAHNYQPPAMNFADGFGSAWVEVRSAELTPEGITAALHAGDFYATCGVQLEDVAFTAADRTLRVKVKAVAGVTYRIFFITTRRGFNQTVSTVASPADGAKPARTIPVYSEDIGRTVKTVDGTEASYQMAEDDLYVRARVESSLPGKFTRNFYPAFQTAWTQPYLTEEPSAGLVPASESTSGVSVPLNTQSRLDRQGVPGAALSLAGYAAAVSEPQPLNTAPLNGTLLQCL